jgi:hypothetical protein
MVQKLQTERFKQIIEQLSTSSKKESFMEEDLALRKSQLCLWHKGKQEEHKGNFDNRYACLDCMKEIKAGRCSVDITNFSADVLFYFRSFWNKVDIKEPDECWPWLGAKREAKYETVAYIISPFHSAKTQSAARVAFWLSRGYTGKHRITHQDGCDYTCCNPLHLRIKGVKLQDPVQISTLNFDLKNFHEHVRSYSET